MNLIPSVWLPRGHEPLSPPHWLSVSLGQRRKTEIEQAKPQHSVLSQRVAFQITQQASLDYRNKETEVSKARVLLFELNQLAEAPELTFLKLLNPINQVLDPWIQDFNCRGKKRLSWRKPAVQSR